MIRIAMTLGLCVADLLLFGCGDGSPLVGTPNAADESVCAANEEPDDVDGANETCGGSAESPKDLLERFQKLPTTVHVIEEPDHPEVGDAHLVALSKVDDLKILDVSGCGKVTDVGLSHLARLSSLGE